MFLSSYSSILLVVCFHLLPPESFSHIAWCFGFWFVLSLLVLVDYSCIAPSLFFFFFFFASLLFLNFGLWISAWVESLLTFCFVPCRQVLCSVHLTPNRQIKWWQNMFLQNHSRVKTWYFFGFSISFSCHNAVLMFWLGLGKRRKRNHTISCGFTQANVQMQTCTQVTGTAASSGDQACLLCWGVDETHLPQVSNN